MDLRSICKYCLIACLMFGARTVHAGFTHDFPYQEAVPDFLEAITDETESVKDETELQAVADWESTARGRLPEFLEDLIDIARQLEDNGSGAFVVKKYQDFADKWNVIAATYPGLTELEPVLNPILDELTSGLPKLKPISPNNPFDNFADLYREMTDLNPWGLGLFWQILFPDGFNKTTELSETTREVTDQGVKSVSIIDRIVNVALNGKNVFSETIQQDEVIARSVLVRRASVLHETLEQMVSNNEDPDHIAVVNELVGLLNANLEMALKEGVLDDCSYSYIFRKQLLGTKETCIDINGEERNFVHMSKFDPFDEVNQVELSYTDPAAVQTIPVLFSGGGQILHQVAAGPAQTAGSQSPTASPGIVAPVNPLEAPVNPWVTGGIMVPAFLWSMAGFMRIF